MPVLKPVSNLVIHAARAGRLLLPVLALGALAACEPVPVEPVEGRGGGGGVGIVARGAPEYRARPDELALDTVVPEIPAVFLTERNRRQWVEYAGPEGANTLVVDPYARLFVPCDRAGPRDAGAALRFGRAGKGFRAMPWSA
ncbi:MAG: hypothetical protein R3D78_04775 [Paracoccaceae bacterium]